LYLHYPFLIELTQGLAVVPETVTDTFTDTANFNKVVGEATFKGGKIGETAAAGQTSVTLHTRQINGVERVIAVVLLASQSRTEDVKRLLAYLDERYPE
jgi:D-alanyl-D-alanine carboxypeptidase